MAYRGIQQPGGRALDGVSESPSPCGRREFFGKLLGGSIAVSAVVSDIKEAAAGALFDVCTESRSNDLMARSCSLNIASSKERMEFLQSMRSVAAFQEMAPMVAPKLAPHQTSIRLVYPGSGAHIAPLGLISELINSGDIEEAEIVMTEIDPCLLPDLERNLKNLCRVDSDFKLEDYASGSECSENGEVKTYYLKYKEKPIQISFMLSCSGKDFYRSEEFTQSDIFVCHDAGDAVEWPARLLYDYLKSAKKTGKLPLILIDDLTRMKGAFGSGEFKKRFDLELLGKMTRGTKPYGHRDHEFEKMRVYDAVMAESDRCRLEAEKRPRYKSTAVDEWLEKGEAPERFMSSESELGRPQCKNGVVLEVHPQLMDLDVEQLEVLMGIDLMANNEYMLGRPMGGASKRLSVDSSVEVDRENALFSVHFMRDAVKNAEGLLKKMNEINPVLRRVLALRMLQAIAQHTWLVNDKVEREYCTGLSPLADTINVVSGYLDPEDLEKLPVLNVRQQLGGLIQKHIELWQKWRDAEMAGLPDTKELFEEWEKATFKKYEQDVSDARFALADRAAELLGTVSDSE